MCLANEIETDNILSSETDVWKPHASIELHIIRICDPQEVHNLLCGLDEFVVRKPQVNLVIIDSIGFPARLALRGYHKTQAPAHVLWADILNKLCYTHKLSVLVTNHLTQVQLCHGELKDVICLGNVTVVLLISGYRADLGTTHVSTSLSAAQVCVARHASAVGLFNSDLQSH
eukprot:Gregarina_sp_Poly_1__2565@NODE_1696_length_3525_cov_61_762869_g517_i1_p2_GENE_NODE_1696_length_3525_cov_61_762869_g517_i1NODE_1696_length_3525_cov_61_762869_g517_i1_p2_ORF_typecomplete_len173_score11_39Rad51/PF08423_11/1_5e09_NODE_1696_length_3525_cov_61_762869_g517_i16401158